MEGKQEILDALHDFKMDVMQKFNEGEKRFDQQSIAISDIQDQIKGNPEKEITGIRPALKEMKKILFIPIIVYRLPAWAKWVLGVVVVDLIVDINNMGFIAFIQWLIHIAKP